MWRERHFCTREPPFVARARFLRIQVMKSDGHNSSISSLEWSLTEIVRLPPFEKQAPHSERASGGVAVAKLARCWRMAVVVIAFRWVVELAFCLTCRVLGLPSAQGPTGRLRLVARISAFGYKGTVPSYRAREEHGETVICAICGRGGTGRHAGFRFQWGRPREGSSPFARTRTEARQNGR